MSTYESVKRSASLEDYANEHLERIGKSYVCPKCKSGTHKNKTPGFSIDQRNHSRWKCFSCGAGGDIFDLAGIIIGSDDRNEQLKHVADWANVPLDTKKPTAQTKPESPKVKKTQPPKDDQYKDARAHERAYVLQAQETLKSGQYPEAMDYLESRGFTFDDAVSLGFGYDPHPKHGAKNSAGEWIETGRIIIPWRGSTYYHIDRAINPDTAEMKYTKPKSETVGSQPIYNPKAFDHDYLFIVEGAFDAAAVSLMGYPVIALGGTGAHIVCNEAVSRDYQGVIISFFDSDEPGRQAASKAAELFDDANIEHIEVDPDNVQGKDAAEMFATDREAFRLMLEDYATWARSTIEELKEQRYSSLLAQMRIIDPTGIADQVFTMEDAADDIPTGFDRLDKLLGGGLTNRLYILTAVSSFGKTTFISQVADQIAAQGRPVLFVSVEQSAPEIVTKSISRIMAAEMGLTESTEDISRKWKRAKYWNDKRLAILREACDVYKQTIAPKLKIIEPKTQPTVQNIEDAVRMITQHEGTAPVVFVDYLQILAPESDRYDERRAAKDNVSRLRHIANRFKTPVFAVSSMARAEYAKEVSMTSFKESGDIEYSADVALGLQPYGLKRKLNETKDSDNAQKKAANEFYADNKGKTDRPCEVKIMKQRHGPTPPDGVIMTFKTLESRFVEYPTSSDDHDELPVL